MKRVILVLAALGLVQSCATVKALPDSDLDARAGALLNGPSSVEPLEATIVRDYVDERVTLVQTILIQNQNGGATDQIAADSPLGIYFGNGLFLDSNHNLSLLVDRLAGVDPGFQGTTRYHHHIPSDIPGHTESVIYGPGTLTVKDDAPLIMAKDYVIRTGEKKIPVYLTSITGVNLVLQDDGKQKVEPMFSLNPLDGTTFETTPSGVKASWWESVGIPLPKGLEYVLKGNVITTSEQDVKVENNGKFLRYAQLKGKHYSFRIYRSAATIVVLNESDASAWVFHQTGTGLTWKQRLVGPLGIDQNQMVDYELDVTPAP